MNFIEWLHFLENNTKLYLSFISDGRVIAYIDGKRYVYSTDAINHDRWRKIAKTNPFKVLNQIKDYVKKGFAQQIEPNPEKI